MAWIVSSGERLWVSMLDACRKSCRPRFGVGSAFAVAVICDITLPCGSERVGPLQQLRHVAIVGREEDREGREEDRRGVERSVQRAPDPLRRCSA